MRRSAGQVADRGGVTMDRDARGMDIAVEAKIEDEDQVADVIKFLIENFHGAAHVCVEQRNSECGVSVLR